MYPSTDSSVPTLRTSAIVPSRSIHQASAGWPSEEEHLGTAHAHLGRGVEQLPQLVVVEPVEELQRAQLGVVHQTLSR